MSKYSGMCMTTAGPITPDQLGATIAHDHLLFELEECLFPSNHPDEADLLESPLRLDNLYAIQHNPYCNRDDCMVTKKDIDIPLKELEYFKQYGGKTMVEATGSRADWDTIHEIAQRAGINVITSMGYVMDYWHTDFVKSASAEEIAKMFIYEAEHGIAGSKYLPGIIKAGTSRETSENEAKVLRACGIAQKETGLSITIHLEPPTRLGHDILDILESVGADLERVILCHVDGVLAQPDMNMHDACDHYVSLADRGCCLEFDLCGNNGHFERPTFSWWLPSDVQRAQAIKNLCLRGHSNQILTSQDTGHKHYMKQFGGWGYGHVLSRFKDTLLEAGLSEKTVHKFNHENPARMLTIK